MILQALTEYYEALVKQGKLDRPGWSKAKVSYAIELDGEGNFLRVHSLMQEEKVGNKTVRRPSDRFVPAPAKRTSGKRASFLCDNASFIFGTDNKGNPERAVDCFMVSKELHLSLLEGINTPCANAVRGFFEKWDPRSANEILGETGYFDELVKGANIIFLVDSKYAQTDPQIEKAWQNHYDASEPNSEASEYMRCLVTGDTVLPERTHPWVKGVAGAQSSGATLVSFNADALCSFGKDGGQNLNAPVGKYASFAYTAALNYLIADKDHKKMFGDTTVVYWSEGGTAEYQDAFSILLDCSGEGMSDDELNDAMYKISQGMAISWQEHLLDPGAGFYILGLAPNASRLSVRFFMRDSFGAMVRHLYQHSERAKIVPDRKAESGLLPLWRLLKATVNESSRDKVPSPKMTGETIRSILTGGRYPATLYQQIQIRIRADRRITWERMAMVKAYLTRNCSDEKIKEGMTVQLNETTTYLPYLLGRLFAVLEEIQERANPSINTTIKDKYFTSACATPAVVFPTLLNLKEKHIRKLGGDTKINCERQVSELMLLLSESFPAHLSLMDHGCFQIGYYHQKQKRFEKKKQEEA